MIRLTSTFIFILYTLSTYSQVDYYKLPKTDNNCPTIIINGNIISNQFFIERNKNIITQIDVMKYKANREDHEFFNLTENGIVFVNIERKIKTKSISELNRFFCLDRKSPVYGNGYLIESSNYKIATESIIEIELLMPNEENQLKNKAINLWTLTESERLKGCQKQ